MIKGSTPRWVLACGEEGEGRVRVREREGGEGEGVEGVEEVNEKYPTSMAHASMRMEIHKLHG